MIKVIYIIFFGLSLILLSKKKIGFVFLIPLFNIISDTSFSFFDGFSLPTVLRAAVLTIFLLYAFPYFKNKSIGHLFYIFFLYVGVMTLFSNELSYSLKASYQVILSMSFFLVGYGLIRNLRSYEKLIKSIAWIVIFGVVATLLGYFWGIGRELEYTVKTSTDDSIDNVGLLGSGGLYTPAVILALTPILDRLRLKIIEKRILNAFMVLLYILILLNVRRTAILIPLIGSLGFIIYSNYRKKILMYVTTLALLLIITFPIYGSFLMERFEIRESQGRFDDDFYKTEQRYIENVNMLESIAQFEKPVMVLFGLGNNIFAEHVHDGKIVRRMFHSDSAKLFYGVGIFGMSLYLIIYLGLFYEILKIPMKYPILIELKSAALGIIFIQLFVSLNGSLTLMTFRIVTFLLLGAFLGLSNEILNKKQSVRSKNMLFKKTRLNKVVINNNKKNYEL